MNTVILSGRIINDVEVRQSTGNNGSTFITSRTSIAVRRPGSRRDKDTGYYPSDLVNIEASGTTGEILSQAKKGEIITVQGYYRIDEYTDRSGQKHYAHKIRINSIERESANIPRNNSQNQQPVQQNQNYNNGNNAMPQQNMNQQMQQPMNQPVSQSATPQMQNNAAPQQQPMQQTIPNGTYDIPQGMPQGQGMPDFSNLDGMPNFDNLPFV